MTATHEAEVALVELVVVVIQVAHGNHSLAVVVVDLGVNAVACNAADVGVEGLSELVGHEFHHLVLDGIALGVLCHELHVGAMFAEFLAMFLIGAARSLLVAGEESVDDGVGVAAYGGGKVGVVVEGQPEVADVVGGVLGFHHGPERHGLYYFALAFAFDVVHELVNALGHGALGAIGLYFVAEFGDELAQRLHFLWVGIVVNAVGKGLCLAPFLYFSEGLGHGAVGQQHEFLDELVGVLGALEVAAGGLSLFVDVEMELLSVEFHGAVLESFATQLLGQSVEEDEQLGVLTLVAALGSGWGGLSRAVDDAVVLKDLLYFLVGVAAVAADDGVDYAR